MQTMAHEYVLARLQISPPDHGVSFLLYSTISYINEEQIKLPEMNTVQFKPRNYERLQSMNLSESAHLHDY